MAYMKAWPEEIKDKLQQIMEKEQKGVGAEEAGLTESGRDFTMLSG